MEAPEEETPNKHASKRKAEDSLINVKKFLSSWDKDVLDLCHYSPERTSRASIAQKMGISEDLVEELSTVCGESALLCGDEPADKNNLLKMKGLPKNIDLTCVKYQERDIERRRMVDYKLFVMHKMKYRMMDVMQLPIDPSAIVNEDKHVPLPNVILIVKVFRTKLNRSFTPKKLSELRDSISCIKDDVVAGDFSDFPTISKEALIPARKIYKSGLFFIEDTFYNDMREADNRDYSKEKRMDVFCLILSKLVKVL